MARTRTQVSLGGTFARRALAAVATIVLTAPVGATRAEVEPLPRRAFLGISVAELDSANADRLAVDGHPGVWVNALSGRSPLYEAGVDVNDVVIAIGETPTPDVAAFAEAAGSLIAGATVEFHLLREGTARRVHARVAEVPLETARGVRVSYEAFEVDGGARLRAIVASPPGHRAARPAVLIVQDLVDGSVEHPLYNPHRELCHALARAGYVAMRFDRRGVGDSEGESFRELSLDEETRDLGTALDYLRERAGVDARDVYLVASAGGGLIASRLATARRGVAGVVLIGPPGEGWGVSVARHVRAELDAQSIGVELQARLDALARASTTVELMKLMPRDLDGRPLGRSVAFIEALVARPPAHVIGEIGVPLALAIPDADPAVGPEDAHAILEERRSRDLPAPDLLVLTETDAHLARAASPAASVEQRRMGLFAFSTDAAETIIGWLDSRSRAHAERPAD